MNIEKVIAILKTEKECVERQGTMACPNRDCANCDLLLPTDDVIEAYEVAIRNLKDRHRSKVGKKYINQIRKVWDALWDEACDAMGYVDCDNDCDEKYLKTLDKLQERFDKAIAHFEL